MKKITLSLLALTIILTGCSSLRVITDQAKNVDMSKYKTFGFAPLEKSKVTPIYFSELNQRRVREAIAKEMAAKGYTMAENPDLKISIYLKIQDKQSVVSSYPYAGRGDFIGIYGGYRYEPASVNIIDYTEGTLIIDLVDTAKNTLIWQGVAIDTIHQNSKHAERNINRAIEKVFQNFLTKNVAK
jgi:hypothetical protein